MADMLDVLLGKGRDRDRRNWTQFETVSEKMPMSVSWDKSVYKQQLVRAVIERIAIACEKLEPKIYGTAKPRIRRAIETSPNQYQTWPQFLNRCATLYWADDNLLIVPSFKEGTDIVTGFYPLRYVSITVVWLGDEPWARITTPTGKVFAIELKWVVILTRFQYESDFFGEPNNLDDTLALLEAQSEAQKNAIRDTGRVQFIAQAQGQVREEDLKEKRDRFAEENLSEENRSGLLAYDASWANMTQVEPKNWTIPTAEMERIENGVFDYFGINRDILQNSYDENQWDAFYEGVVEPWAIQLGEALSQALFTMRERPANRIEFSANRLAYASAASKRNMNKDMGDRGVMTLNEMRANLQLPPVPGGDVVILRGEYKVGRTIEEILRVQEAQAEADGRETMSDEKDIDDKDSNIERPDSEGHGNAGDTDSGDATTSKQDRWD